MNKHNLVVIGFIVCLLLLSGCFANASLTEEALTQTRLDLANGITISTEKEEYSTSTNEITVLIENNSNEDYLTGVPLFLEKRVDDKWYRVPMKANEFTEQGVSHPLGEMSSLGLNVKELKYTLTPGQYRATLNELAAPFAVVE